MTAITTNYDRARKEDEFLSIPVAATTKIPAGAIVCYDTDGVNAVNGADTSGLKFAGIACDLADNSAGAAGAIEVKVRRRGVYEFAKSGTPVVGDPATIADNNTVSNAAGTTNDVVCGLVVQGGTKVWVDIAKL